MAERFLRHPVAASPCECGECRVFNILSRPAFDEYTRGEPVRGECRRFAPSRDLDGPLFPRVWSDYAACPDALGALESEKTGPLA